MSSTRRKRFWTATEPGTTQLARSAQHLARVSASRIIAPAARACLAKYQYVTSIERSAKLIRGDLLRELIEQHGVRAIDIARRTGERPADLSEMYSVAKAFPRDQRPSDAIYNHLLLATRAVKRFPKMNLLPAEALAEIQRVGLSQHRDVTRHFHRLERQHRSSVEQSDPEFERAAMGTALLDRCHHGRFQDLLSQVPAGSIQVFCIDPVYVYARDERPYRARAARSLACDGADVPEEAIGAVLDVLRDWQSKLAAGGVVLLWQPWQSLLGEIGRAALTYAWEVTGPIIWNKARPQPGRFTSPYSVQGEFLWLLHRPQEDLVDHGHASREMILRYPPVSSRGSAPSQLHAFEKPVALCEHLVRKHSRPGDVVFDACGCTASMSVAAHNTGRHWIYVESNAENFALGAGRLAEATKQI